MTATDLIVDGEVLEREIPGVGTLVFEDLGPGEWRTQRGEPARKARRRYTLNGEELLGVSSIVDTLHKPALVRWAEEKSIEGTMRAIQERDLDAGCEPALAVQHVRDMALGAEGARDEAAERGKAIHSVFYRYCTTGEVPKLSDFPYQWQPWVKGAARALLELDPEPDEAEQIVCNPTYLYGGRPDLICRSRGKRTLLDWKTGKGRVYDSAHYQTRGYALALEPCGIEPVEDIVIVGISDQGDFQPVRCEATELDFLGLLSVHRSRQRINAGMAAQRKAARKA